MPRLVFTPRYLKNKKPSAIKNYVKYIATRPNAENYNVNVLNNNATKNQKDWIEKELNKYPSLKEIYQQEYECYIKNPTIGNASELIEKIAEEGMARENDVENYVSYIAKRPRAERGEQGHALWNGSNEVIDINEVAKETANHKGNIWTFVISLKREDAERLGYNNASAWRELVRAKSVELARAMGISVKNFVWYGAFHNEGHHPHIHLMCYSKNPREGYLGNKNFMKLRSSFANEIFYDEIYHIYEEKDEMRETIKKYFDEKLKESMSMKESENTKIQLLLWQLSKNLKTSKHKKVYGRLDKENKILVDEIVREISKDEKINMVYESWVGLKNDILSTYKNQTRSKNNLADETEFRNIKNMVLKSALDLSEMDKTINDDYKEVEKDDNNKEPLSEKEIAIKETKNTFLQLMKNVSNMIEEDYDNKKKFIKTTDKKLMSKILEKKQSQGQKM